MFEQVFDNDYITINFAKDENIAVIKWKEKCGNLMNKKNNTLFDNIRGLIKNITPSNLLVDMSACEYHAKANTGTWFKNPLFALYADLPPVKIALILPQNLFVQAFFEASLAREKADPNKKLQYFKDNDKAWDWIQS
jgi:hypothetical protein